MRTSAAINLLELQSQSAEMLKSRRGDWARFNTWEREAEIRLERIFGTKSKHIRTFKSISYSSSVSVGARDLSEEERQWRKGLDEAQEFFRILTEEVRQLSFLGFIRLPRDSSVVGVDTKISIGWLWSNLPISYVAIAFATLLAVFLAGVRVGQVPAVREILNALFPK